MRGDDESPHGAQHQPAAVRRRKHNKFVKDMAKLGMKAGSIRIGGQ